MKHAGRSASSDVEVQDLEVMLLEGKLREANRQLVQAFNQDEKLVSRLSKLCAPRRPTAKSARW